MKNTIYYIILIIICCFMSCQSNKKNSNIVLTYFTQELISMYINDFSNLDAKNRKDEIIITYGTDTSYYYLSVFANNSKEYDYCSDDFVGHTFYLGHLIRVFGSDSSIFYSVTKKIKAQKQCDDYIVAEYDPNVWDICFHKDLSFCKMRTYKTYDYEDILDIQSLAKKYFSVSDTINDIHKNEVFQFGDVENRPTFSLGENSMRQIISTNFKVKRDNIHSKVAVIVDIIVDKNGKATLKGISRSSNDIELDNEAIRVAEIICQYEFIPAQHKGHKVNTTSAIVFLQKDIAP